MTLRAWMATLCLVTLVAGSSGAAVRHVPLNFPTITAALATALPGDTVLVAAGTYSPSTNGETFPLQMAIDGIRLLGAGMDATVLDAQGTGSVIRHTATVGGRISGFKITGGSNPRGGGVDIVDGNVEIDHDRIEGNGASIGGAGIWALNAPAPWIHHNLFLDNFSTSAADVHAVRLNQGVTGVFEHNLVAHSDGNGLLTVDSVTTSIRHNIFYQNGTPSPSRGRGICWLSESRAEIFHNLFFQNQLAALLWLGGGGDFSGTTANNFDLMDGVYGNLDLDPLFVDPGAGDYHLTDGSPAIDGGDPTLPYDPDGTIADLGPFAYARALTVPPARGAAIALSATPNPLRHGADIHFALPARARVRVEVMDPSGRLVRMLDNGTREAGTHVLRWNGSDHAGQPSASGVYYVRLQAGSFARTLPLIVIR